MNDREMLELAAKAAGLTPDGSCGKGILAIDAERMARPFDPINDDGDALRLAVKLNIRPVKISNGSTHAYYGEEPFDWYMEELHKGDPYAATRRAIVRAAAEIGKEIP